MVENFLVERLENTQNESTEQYLWGETSGIWGEWEAENTNARPNFRSGGRWCWHPHAWGVGKSQKKGNNA